MRVLAIVVAVSVYVLAAAVVAVGVGYVRTYGRNHEQRE